MPEPRLLDLCCCAGGAAMGYHRVGFTVTGVDIDLQPRYPFEFYQADAIEFLAEHGSEFDVIHISPPCQNDSPLNAYNRKIYPALIEPAREILTRLGKPYVIENVPQAALIDPITLCGSMFGLSLYRHRVFESNIDLTAPAHPPHVALCTRNGYLPSPERPFMSVHGGKHSKAWQVKAADVMGVPWVDTIREVCEAIPPAYTEHIGEQLMSHA